LASVDAEAPQLEAGERTSVGTTWQQLQPTDVTSVADLRLTPALGSSFLSLRLGQADRAQTVTLATWTLPNFITLITVTSKPDGQLNLCQYILPLGQHQGQLTPEQQVGFDFTNRQLLPDMLFRARLERTFRQRRDLWRTLSDAQLEALTTGQWTDPVASPLVAYALARRGRTREIPPIAAALAKAYPTHPDIPALLAICGGGDPASAVGYGSGLSIPLFLDGLRALPYSICPLPLSHLEASGPWSTWQLGRQS
jgi:hypothetical protein